MTNQKILKIAQVYPRVQQLIEKFTPNGVRTPDIVVQNANKALQMLRGNEVKSPYLFVPDFLAKQKLKGVLEKVLERQGPLDSFNDPSLLQKMDDLINENQDLYKKMLDNLAYNRGNDPLTLPG
jgi:hypothetical protein